MAGWQDRILLGPRRGAGAVAVREVEPRDLCGDGPRWYLCPDSNLDHSLRDRSFCDTFALRTRCSIL